ncbi:hypothetical protein [Streptomyces sp. NPDC007991]|uniref:hypothetical protein n=1 Tax=Streptomyces sp. NPDC007991 TaxID=3364803 RepID=UPI0036E7B4EC
MDTTLTDAVFAAAAKADTWTRTNLGPRTDVRHAGYTWTVELPASGEGVARIVGRDGYAGTEFLDVPATPAQTIPIVDAATATPQDWPVFTLQRWDWDTNTWEAKATYTSQRGEGNAQFAVSSERASGTGPIRLLRDGAAVIADDPDTYYLDQN